MIRLNAQLDRAPIPAGPDLRAPCRQESEGLAASDDLQRLRVDEKDLAASHLNPV
jgi:hypothetical protein